MHSLERTNENQDLFCVVRIVHFGMKLYNDQYNACIFNLFISLLLPYMFQAFFSAHLQRLVYNFGRGSSLSAWALSPGPGDLTHCQNCAPASEDVLKESLKRVRQK
jgi:hypothetical protein